MTGQAKPIDTKINDPATCSNKVCYKSNSTYAAQWLSVKVHEGCNCCEVNGSIVDNGYQFCLNGRKHGSYNE